MWKYRYGEFDDSQIDETLLWMRKQIFFLLLITDPSTKNNYPEVNVDEAFISLLSKFGGLNDLLGEPSGLVKVMGLINSAYIEYKSPEFNPDEYRRSNCRRFILEAGDEVIKVKEV